MNDRKKYYIFECNDKFVVEPDDEMLYVDSNDGWHDFIKIIEDERFHKYIGLPAVEIFDYTYLIRREVK